MNDKKYEVLKVTKRNNSTQYLIEIKREDINKDFLENLRLEIEAGVYDDYEVELIYINDEFEELVVKLKGGRNEL